MIDYIKRHRETALVTMLGLMIFSALNWMMMTVDPQRFMNLRFGPFTAFANLFVSGFDSYTYSVVSVWEPRYELYRHPLLAMTVWPMSEVNQWLKGWFNVNCAIYVVGVVWTVISTVSWVLLYKIIRRVVEVSWVSSVIYTLLFFSLSHVMIATFYPDHMILTLCLLLTTIYTIAKAKEGMPAWKTMLLYFLATGITTTNCVKIWMMDMCGKYSTALSLKENISRLFKRSLLFLIPTILLGGCYLWQEENTQQDYRDGQAHMIAEKIRRDSVFARHHEATLARDMAKNKAMKDKQLGASGLFKSTDMSVDRLSLVYENIFGEGLLLHDTHVLEDAGAANNPRPVIVRYTHWWYYAINGVIVVLALCGIWAGRRKRILWMVLPAFLFDMLLHVGLEFASIDVYIMTAHWAFLLPIAIALLEKGMEQKRLFTIALRCVVLAITLFLWYHNLTLTATHLTQF